MTKIVGFIGLGNMGGPMALNLLKAGQAVSVFDRDSSKIQHCLEKGATAADGVVSLAGRVDVLITCLPGPREVRAVALGEHGLIAGLRPGSVWIDMTTNDPSFTRQLEERVSARHASMLDAPVTGAVDGARRGTLAIFVGGTSALFQSQLALLQRMGSTVIYCGPLGAGNVVKLVTNQLWYIHAAAIAEGLILGVRSGVEPLTLWRAIKSSVGNSFVAEHDVPAIFAGHYDPSFTLDLCLKDLGLIMGLSESTRVPVELTSKAMSIFDRARAKYGGASGELYVAKLLEDATGTSLRVEGSWIPPWEA